MRVCFDPQRNGTWREFVVVDAKRAVAVPDSLADEQAAMYLANPISAYVLVREVLKVSRGGWVLITAAEPSGGSVPEPAGTALLALGLAALAFRRRRSVG